MNKNSIADKFWQDRVVLVTGHTGFKGSWLSLWLSELGAKVIGFSLPPPTSVNLYTLAGLDNTVINNEGDIRNQQHLENVLREYNPEIVFHLAAQSLVKSSYEQPVDTYETNLMGSVYLLEAIRKTTSVCSVVMVTTDKCYENKEWHWGYRENEPMGGHDPYSSSKACMELMLASYRHSFFIQQGIAMASVRAGNVIGGGDWAKDRLIADMMQAFLSNKIVLIRNPNAIRPWQHVLEPLAGYIEIAQKLTIDSKKYASAWNLGPDQSDAKTVQWIVNKVSELWSADATWALDDGPHMHEATYLKLDCSKALNQLTWRPRWNLDKALKNTVNWYRAYQHNANMRQVCIDQIHQYTHDYQEQN